MDIIEHFDEYYVYIANHIFFKFFDSIKRKIMNVLHGTCGVCRARITQRFEHKQGKQYTIIYFATIVMMWKLLNILITKYYQCNLIKRMNVIKDE